MSGGRAALRRLTMIQASWNYERMLGVGFAWGAEPLLRDLEATQPGRLAEAAARSAEFFNSHPYLAGLAVGATVRAERDGAPGEQIRRLRTALCGPLGALGDQLFWAGVLPAVMAGTLLAVAAGWALPGVVAALVLYNGIRWYVAGWALRTGMHEGMRVAAAISGSRLNDAAQRIGRLAGLLVGCAIPVTVRWLLAPGDRGLPLLALVLGVAGIVVWRFQPRLTGLRLGLLAFGITVVAWGVSR